MFLSRAIWEVCLLWRNRSIKLIQNLTPHFFTVAIVVFSLIIKLILSSSQSFWRFNIKTVALLLCKAHRMKQRKEVSNMIVLSFELQSTRNEGWIYGFLTRWKIISLFPGRFRTHAVLKNWQARCYSNKFWPGQRAIAAQISSKNKFLMSRCRYKDSLLL